jgi:hypothetical protein
MPLDAKLRALLEQQLKAQPASSHPQANRPDVSRLSDDAQRLFARVRRLVDAGAVAAGTDLDALELAAYAMQLPMRHCEATSKLGVVSLLERSNQAAELLVGLTGDVASHSLLDRATRLLHEASQRTPMLDEAKLLADATSLEDFGVTGLCRNAMRLVEQDAGLTQLTEAVAKREAYGYWDARLKEGFHFDASRQIATERLAQAREAFRALLSELSEDRQ